MNRNIESPSTTTCTARNMLSRLTEEYWDMKLAKIAWKNDGLKVYAFISTKQEGGSRKRAHTRNTVPFFSEVQMESLHAPIADE